MTVCATQLGVATNRLPKKRSPPMFQSTSRSVCLLSLVVASMVGCSAPPNGERTNDNGGDAITDGIKATDFTEAAVITVYDNGVPFGYCSATLIAPRVV